MCKVGEKDTRVWLFWLENDIFVKILNNPRWLIDIKDKDDDVDFMMLSVMTCV